MVDLVVHFLGRLQLPLAELFGGETGDEVDKFELCDWAPGPDGVPVLAGVPGWFGLGFQAVKRVDPGHPV